jgi:hypothetical protein
VNAQLSALLTQHKTAVLGAGGAAVVGLALLQRKKTAAGASAVPGAAARPVASATYPGGVAPAAYNSSASDVYNAIQPLFDQLSRATSTPSAIPVPASPMAATLSAPTYTGQYVAYGDGSVQEVQGDGSLYHLSLPEYGDVQRRFGSVNPAALAGPAPSDYSYTANLQTKVNTAASKYNLTTTH